MGFHYKSPKCLGLTKTKDANTITGAVYNCKDEDLASISVGGDVIIHNLASAARATELKDPNRQWRAAVTAGDDGSVHLWDSTNRSPKVSWLKQHSAPTAGVSFSPTNDKVIASIGLDKKLYTLDSGSRRHVSCIPCEAPFSSLAFRDDGNILAAGTSSGRVVFYDVRGNPQPFTVLRAYGNSEAVTSMCWQRSKPVIVNENNSLNSDKKYSFSISSARSLKKLRNFLVKLCPLPLENSNADIALLGVSVEDSVLMPDPFPSMTSSNHSTISTLSGSRSLSHPGSSNDLHPIVLASCVHATLEEPPKPITVTKKKALLESFAQEKREKRAIFKEAETFRGSFDWFSKYENPEPQAEKDFVYVQKAEKCRKILKFLGKLSKTSVVGRNTVVMLHKDVHQLYQEVAPRQFSGDVMVLVATHDILLATNVRKPFHLINFDFPMYFKDYEALVGKSQKTTTFINEESSGLTLRSYIVEDC
ncbi:hypothetical protein POM88_051863 [Heracleum sosnowskyi]|uniref:Uncharacterized protein n=1 Tax=Heracleum sosnowskyi TaxID=360622 RepID=A0AAD8GS18_9APIA|nr:hypothetical protein POM88_051863 [Heracleum sosnowskyi]